MAVWASWRAGVNRDRLSHRMYPACRREVRPAHLPAMQQAIDIAALPVLEGGATVVILQSKWYADIVGSLHAKCVEVLQAKGVDHIVTHTLPGSLEFAFAANEVVETNPGVDAIVCLGVVLKGDTYHFEMIVDECVRGLGEVSRRARVPVVNEVLPVTELAHAQARAADDEFNKGIEAAAAAIEIIHWRRQIKV
ncbi:MAG: 6,7-dimethyl-8-ribityllumazine synthase [Gammaproteobacteria bacterium]|nr:6,7-dimethyl-8-ribityllumazine synthase [Gammaproteobacteria bacterium]